MAEVPAPKLFLHRDVQVVLEGLRGFVKHGDLHIFTLRLTREKHPKAFAYYAKLCNADGADSQANELNVLLGGFGCVGDKSLDEEQVFLLKWLDSTAPCALADFTELSPGILIAQHVQGIPLSAATILNGATLCLDPFRRIVRKLDR